MTHGETNKFLESANGSDIGDGQTMAGLENFIPKGQGFDGGPEEFSEQVSGEEGFYVQEICSLHTFWIWDKKSHFSNTAGIKLRGKLQVYKYGLFR